MLNSDFNLNKKIYLNYLVFEQEDFYYLNLIFFLIYEPYKNFQYLLKMCQSIEFKVYMNLIHYFLQNN